MDAAAADTWGHAVGHEVLVATASVLRDAVRSDDLVVCLGGEELAVIGSWQDEVDRALHVAKRAGRDRVHHSGLPAAPAPDALQPPAVSVSA